MSILRSSDPMERIIEKALISIGEIYQVGHENEHDLDFYLPYRDIYIEVKQFHSDRISKQTAKVDNIIVLQGVKACELFAALIGR